MSKKIGIFTLTESLNYGAFFQMYALNTFLASATEGVGSVVTYKSELSIKHYLLQYFAFSLSRTFRKNLVRTRFKNDRKAINVQKYMGENLDLAILGSDEIWNLENDSFTHSERYLGNNIEARRKVAYAPSVGFATGKDLKLNSGFFRGVKSLDEAYPRDTATKEILSDIRGDKNIFEVPDPTILLDNWQQLGSDNPGLKDYIVYYGYDNNPKFKESLLEFCKSNDFRLVSAGLQTHNWCDQNLMLSPMQFLGLIKNASGIVTNTFHGSLLSILVGAPLKIHANSQKLINLISKFELHHHLINDYEKFENINENWEISNGTKKMIEKHRAEGRSVLTDILTTL